MVVRRLTNHSGVLKVYLIGSKKYAYRLKFKRAVVPEWVVTAMNSISEGAVIGFEDNPEEELELPDSNQMMLPAVADGDIAEVNDDNEQGEPDQGDDELHEALRVLERAEEPDFAEEEPNIVTRSRTDANRL